jgi:hypothetical protein
LKFQLYPKKKLKEAKKKLKKKKLIFFVGRDGAWKEAQPPL